jgi:catechol 2,3-dioxygenase-like lactoylglutathione lyase family enzyme
VHIGPVQVTVTDREFAPMELHRYQGLDHFALTTDDFEATLAHLEKEGVHLWFGPVTVPDTGRRIVFIDGPDQVKIELMEKA